MILDALLIGWAILFAAILSIGVTMLVVALIRKNGLSGIDVVNMVMAEVCVFTVVLIIMFMLLGS
jgi:hypothetical protein